MSRFVKYEVSIRITKEAKMKVRQVKKEDYEGIAKLEEIVWGEGAASVNVIESRHSVFPEGSIVVVDRNNVIVGYAAVQRVNRVCADSWFEQTDNGFIRSTHSANGHIVYGIGMSGNRYGVSDLLIDHVYQKFISSGECYMIALGSRLPGFSAWKDKSKHNIKEYIQSRREDGYSIDPELLLYQKHGFEVLFEIPNYFPCDESLGYGSLIVRR